MLLKDPVLLCNLLWGDSQGGCWWEFAWVYFRKEMVSPALSRYSLCVIMTVRCPFLAAAQFFDLDGCCVFVHINFCNSMSCSLS